jgi:hypothetical protein
LWPNRFFSSVAAQPLQKIHGSICGIWGKVRGMDTTCQGRLPQFEPMAELGLGVPGKSKVEWSREGWSIF